MSRDSFLVDIAESVQARFVGARSIMSFGEYIEATRKEASLFCRNSAQYIRDAFLYFGTETSPSPCGDEIRYKLFDANPHNNERSVIGQEQAQQALFRSLGSFVRDGRSSRLLLLHGPNGSGKSSLVQSMIRALEYYSHTEEGASYRFNWIFPSDKIKRSGIGFASDDKAKTNKIDYHSYAHLEGDQIEARIPSFLKDHPLLLLPHPERQRFFQHLRAESLLPDNFQLSEYLENGDIDPRSRMIFDALMAHYSGNFAEVMRHIQIERYYISQRYRSGGVTIEPQMHVDASVRQVSADRSLASLPKPLNNLNLFEAYGTLVDANRGLLEFSDLLKRPVEAFKYLLGTCETGRANVEPVILFLDLLMVGNANELNLDRFKEISEFISFKSRIELIRVPYILRYTLEQKIYDDQLAQSTLHKPIAPHLSKLAAIWTILTRLKRPNPARLPEALAPLAETLTPLEKAHLYDHGAVPDRFTTEQAKVLKTHLEDLFHESDNDIHYEGRIGASPREIRIALLNAAQNDAYPSVSPLAFFDELEELVQQRSVYEFLQLEPLEGYYDPEVFIEIVRKEHIRIVDREFQAASGLVQATRYGAQFKRYIQHVNASLQKEKVHNPITLAAENPDERFMEQIESSLLSDDDDKASFRQGIMSKIAVQSLDNPGKEVDLTKLFRHYIETLETTFYATQRKRLRKIAKNSLICLVEDKPKLNADEATEAQSTLQRLQEEFGYPRESIRETISLLLSQRYATD